MSDLLQHRVVGAGIRLVFPAVCPSCSSDLSSTSAGPLCLTCLKRFPFDPLCEPGRRRSLAVVYSTAKFEGPARQLLLRLKYGGRDDLAEWWAVACLDQLSLDVRGFDCLVPVPMSVWGEWKRGYNQAHLLAAAFARRFRLPVADRWLGSRMFHLSQTRLDRRDRFRNARRRFFLRRKMRFPFRYPLLVDDVKTTGATLERCAHLLRLAGAHRVAALVAARDTV